MPDVWLLNSDSQGATGENSVALVGPPGSDPCGCCEEICVYDVVSLTRSGTVATLETSLPHGLSVDDTGKVSGASQTNFNGVKVVTGVPDSTHITYTVPASGASPVTGTKKLNVCTCKNVLGTPVATVAGIVVCDCLDTTGGQGAVRGAAIDGEVNQTFDLVYASETVVGCQFEHTETPPDSFDLTVYADGVQFGSGCTTEITGASLASKSMAIFLKFNNNFDPPRMTMHYRVGGRAISQGPPGSFFELFITDGYLEYTGPGTYVFHNALTLCGDPYPEWDEESGDPEPVAEPHTAYGGTITVTMP